MAVDKSPATKWALALAGLALASIGGGLVAWGGRGADMAQHERRITAVETAASQSSTVATRNEARLDALEKWLTRIEQKLDKALIKR